MPSNHPTNPRLCRAAWRGLAAILVLTAFAALPAAAQGTDAVVRGEPGVLELGVGETAGVAIVLADARDVYAIDVRATYDPQVVEIVDADPARDGVQLVPGAFPQPDFVARNVADNAAGALRYAITQVNPTAPASGVGSSSTCGFAGRPPGATTLAVGPVELADRRGRGPGGGAERRDQGCRSAIADAGCWLWRVNQPAAG